MRLVAMCVLVSLLVGLLALSVIEWRLLIRSESERLEGERLDTRPAGQRVPFGGRPMARAAHVSSGVEHADAGGSEEPEDRTEGVAA